MTGTGCLRRLCTILGTVALTACLAPAQRVDRLAAAQGFTRHVVHGTRWQHVVYTNAHVAQANRVHVYVEGDGSPWIRNRSVARDPTPRQPLMLSLMALDSAPAIYLGRPCYFGLHDRPGCESRLWTSDRYSAEVVASMASALRRLPILWPRVKSVHWFGHSGGGTLAMLLAGEFARSESVVTIAGNLDPEAWAHHHGYTPLEDSLNPSRLELAAKVREIHLIGERDEIIPLHLWSAVLSRRPRAEQHRYPEFDHHCCWQQIWPDLLPQLRAAAGG